MYGCETWTISKPIQKKNRSSGNVVLEANVKNTMDCKENKSRSNGRSWTHKIIGQQNKKTASFVCWSHNEKERIGTPCDHRENGGETRTRRQREQMIDSLAAWMDIDKTASAISAAKDRAVWIDMIANTLGQGT